MGIQKFFAILSWTAFVWTCACGADDAGDTYDSNAAGWATNTGSTAGTGGVPPFPSKKSDSILPDATAIPTAGTDVAKGPGDAGIVDTNVTIGEPDAGSGDGGGFLDNNPTNGAGDAGIADANIVPGDPDAASDSGGGDSGSGQLTDAGSPCTGGQFWPASDDINARATFGDQGEVHFVGPPTLKIVGLETTLTVPEEPSSNGTLYIWPGLEPMPGVENYQPIGHGVLQPVLTWGTSAGDFAPRFPTGWWIAPQYVNPWTSLPDYYYAHGGPAIFVDPGDVLDITISLNGTVWSQTVFDRQTGETANYDIDMAGQVQCWAIFEIERPNQNKPVHDIVFTSSVLTFADPAPEECQPTERGADDYFAPPQSSPDGTKCCISRIILRAPGVPATTPNTP